MCDAIAAQKRNSTGALTNAAWTCGAQPQRRASSAAAASSARARAPHTSHRATDILPCLASCMACDEGSATRNGSTHLLA
eukprot:3077350-Prymnesium_polylepis.1